MGASILPITLINNKICFLFGKERDIDENPGWSDFGGGTEKGETFLDTAIREGSEELTGFLGSPKKIKEMAGFSNHGFSTGFAKEKAYSKKNEEHLENFATNVG